MTARGAAGLAGLRGGGVAIEVPAVDAEQVPPVAPRRPAGPELG